MAHNLAQCQALVRNAVAAGAKVFPFLAVWHIQPQSDNIKARLDSTTFFPGPVLT
jgi:hypothetical protein